MNISIRIQKLRERANLSQEQLADKLDVSRQAISKWETGQANPDIENIILLSNVFNVPTDYILKGIEIETIKIPEQQKPQEWKYSDIFKVLLTIFGVTGVGYLAVLLARLLISLGR